MKRFIIFYLAYGLIGLLIVLALAGQTHPADRPAFRVNEAILQTYSEI